MQARGHLAESEAWVPISTTLQPQSVSPLLGAGVFSIRGDDPHLTGSWGEQKCQTAWAVALRSARFAYSFVQAFVCRYNFMQRSQQPARQAWFTCVREARWLARGSQPSECWAENQSRAFRTSLHQALASGHWIHRAVFYFFLLIFTTMDREYWPTVEGVPLPI